MNKTKLNISIIPLIIIIAVVGVLGYYWIGGELRMPSFGKDPEITRFEGFPTVMYTDQKIDKQRRIITNQAELDEFLMLMDSAGLLKLNTQIDFEKYILLGVSTETEDKVGNSIKVKKAYEDRNANTMLIVLEESVRGETCEIEIDPNIALDLVAISKTDAKIDFDRVKKVVECNLD